LRHNKISITSEIGNNNLLRNCIIGKWVFVGPKGTFNNVEIGNYTCIAPSCQIGGLEHTYWEASISPKLSNSNNPRKTTHIGHDVWIAANCIIRQGVNIGDGAVVGAGSFVNKDVPPYAIVFGSPAKLYKYRFDQITIDELNKSHYWEFAPQKARRILEKIIINEAKVIPIHQE
jgi:acetyltransferase-like isoleucine patch superfamily enzyme